ncbi:MAG: VapC toxin family PIN domain ribonuclease [Acidobacteria bacterium]|nr:MAG: VapC toxin family PIN domain ribonuclease [Acidobacteriota bacterium]
MSAGFLLDVNVLIAVAWPAHLAHQRVQKWIARYATDGWATCPFTETAFVRILSNPVFSPNALTPVDALSLLRANLGHPAHRFWADDISFPRAVEPFAERLFGHQQVSDAYLLGLAIHRKGRLATLDRGVLTLLPEKSSERSRVVII